MESFAGGGLEAVRIELVDDPRQPGEVRWRAEFSRPGRVDAPPRSLSD
jgi:hypothetical protein